MSGIILDGRLIKALEALQQIGEYAGRDKGWLDMLWQELIEEPELMKEFIYYVDNHSFADKFSCCGYYISLSR